jgi:uncharacterized protein YecT (DUF1311 family)
MKLLFFNTLLLILSTTTIFAQGNIEHIKNQEYLKHKSHVDCTNHAGDNLSERICANLAFQKADSLLKNVYDSLLLNAKEHYIDSLENKIIQMQTTWRLFRDQHCAIIYQSYEGCSGCHQRSIDYLYCLTELTENRIKELKTLYQKITGQ